jgi:hypothetical protein
MGEDDRKILISRMGTFFLLMGLGFMILFVASDLGDETSFSYFFLGLLCLGLGWFFKRVSAPPPKPSQRFSWLRNYMQQRRENKAKREAERKARFQKR